MKKDNLKFRAGFTLVEILFVLILAGIIAVLSLQLIRFQQGNFKHAYYFAYYNLKMVVGDVVARSSTKSVVADPTVVSNEFCTALADRLNVIDESASCTNVYALSPSKAFSGITTADLGSPSMELTNGQRFYVGNTFFLPGAENYFDTPATLVAIDLNGEAGPNKFDSRTYTGNATPDIVAFAVLNNGTVLPMSPMADRTNYIAARIETCDLTSATKSCSTSNRYSLRQALAIGNVFPPNSSGTLTKTYATDNTYSFKQAYTVSANCSNFNYSCKVIVDKPIALKGLGSAL